MRYHNLVTHKSGRRNKNNRLRMAGITPEPTMPLSKPVAYRDQITREFIIIRKRGEKSEESLLDLKYHLEYLEKHVPLLESREWGYYSQTKRNMDLSRAIVESLPQVPVSERTRYDGLAARFQAIEAQAPEYIKNPKPK